MDGNLFGYQIPPDMFQSINPIMILLFIPLFDFGIYPLLGTMFPFKAQFLCVSSFCPIKNLVLRAMNIKIKILLHFFQFLDKFRLCRTDLQRIVTGGILAGMAFIVSGVLELKLSVSFTNL